MDSYRFTTDVADYPAMIADHALRAPAIEDGFPEEYQQRYVNVAETFARHIIERGWGQTRFQCYFNDKYYYKDPQQGGRGVSWWLLDEPNHRDDWLALRFFSRLFKAGVAKADDPANLIVRADISRMQWQRDWLDDACDLEVLGNDFFRYRRRTLDRLHREGATGWVYGTANAVGRPNTDTVGWCLRAWLAGCDGVVPWNSIGGDGTLDQAEPTALMVCGRRFGLNGPVASLRVKAFLAGEQEVERLRLLAEANGWTRDQVAAACGGLVQLGEEAGGRGGEDAGWLAFRNLRPDDVARLREAVAMALEAGR